MCKIKCNHTTKLLRMAINLLYIKHEFTATFDLNFDTFYLLM